MIGAGLVSGAASLIGNTIGTISSNSKNMQINKMNNDFNAREAEKARKYQTEMWNKTNEWNSPKNVRKRLQEAGYNPYLGMDSSNVGTASNTGSSSPASAAPPIQNNRIKSNSRNRRVYLAETTAKTNLI